MTKPKQWDRHAILAELRRSGMTLAGLSKRYDLCRSSVNNIWSRPNQKVEQAIADYLGYPAQVLFPDRYPKTRNRILKQPTELHTAHKRAGATRKAA